MCLENEHVQQRCLSVVDMTCNHDVSDHRRILHQVNHEAEAISLSRIQSYACNSLSVESRGRETLFLHCERSDLDGRHDWLGQQLCVLLLHHRLDILSISLLGSRVVFLVLVQDDLISSGTYSSLASNSSYLGSMTDHPRHARSFAFPDPPCPHPHHPDLRAGHNSAWAATVQALKEPRRWIHPSHHQTLGRHRYSFQTLRVTVSGLLAFDPTHEPS
jgi:hypothetical protein